MLHPTQLIHVGTLLVATAPMSLAQWSSDTAANQVVSAAPSDQSQPKVVARPDGGYWIAWFDGIASGWDVRIQRYDFEGNEAFAPGGILVADRSYSSTQDYGIDVTQEGDLLLAFRDDSSGLTEITAARYRADGTAVYGPNGTTLTNAAGFVASPRIAQAGGWTYVAWIENGGTRVRSLNAAGSPGAADHTFAPAAGSYQLSDLRGIGEDAALALVHQTGGFSSPRHLVAQRLDPAGNRPFGDTPVPVMTNGSLQIGNYPRLSVNRNGDFVFAWYTSSPSLQCYAQLIDSGGSPLWQANGVPVATAAGAVRVNPIAYSPTASEPSYEPDVVVAWREQNASQSAAGISMQRIDRSTGARQWGDSGVVVEPQAPFGSTSPALTFDATSGDYAVAWIQSTAFGADVIRGARVTGAGAPGQPFAIASASTPKARLSAAAGALGGFLTTWSDGRSDGGDIYAQQMQIGGAAGATEVVSTPTCAGVNNSTGGPSQTFATGSAITAEGRVVLRATHLPPNAFSFFLTSQTQDFVVGPGMSAGNLCLGGDIGRFVGPGQVLAVPGSGNVRLTLDLANHPTPNGFVSVAAGETWTFQLWHRDVVGPSAGSNFSGAAAIVFQ